jgi:hypothetical protein
MRRVILTLSLILIAAPAARAQLKGADRDLFVSSSIKGCAEGAEQEKLTIPPDKMTAFCACMANKQADMTTKADPLRRLLEARRRPRPHLPHRRRDRAVSPNAFYSAESAKGWIANF